HDNTGLGIDLGNDGRTLNQPAGTPGPNGFTNFPVVTAATVGPKTQAGGTLAGLPNTAYALDFFASDRPHPSGYGEGQTYLGAATVTTNAAGQAAFNVAFDTQTGADQVLTVTATGAAG